MSNIRRRLGRLEQQRQRSVPEALTDEERLARANWLLAYEGTNPDLVYRRDRLRELLRRAQERKARAG